MAARTRMMLLTGSALIVLGGCDQSSSANETLSSPSSEQLRVMARTDLEAGRYLVQVGGCNDCHTPAYARTNGAQPPESDWLRGSPEPHTGPWGTSYGKNLRLTVASHTEDEWVELLDTGTSLPPMPWPSVRAMSETDKRAIYRYIRSLPGEVGEPAPAALPPSGA